VVYPRDPNGPVLGGDITDEGEVLGFGYSPTSDPHAGCDRLLLVGDEDLVNPPDRLVPPTAATLQELAPAPQARLDDSLIHQAAALDAALPQAMHGALTAPGAPWSEVGWPLITALTKSMHSVWVAGGATRDLIGGTTTAVKDLDLAGTAPPGRFCDIARTLRRSLGLEYRPKVSTNSLVCWALDPKSGERIYEYRTLKLTGLNFPASGSDLRTDAGNRDLTVNSLYYDAVNDQVLDPTERGLADLAAKPRKFVSVNESDSPSIWAPIIVRVVKFAVRWKTFAGFDVSQLRERLSDFPVGLRDKLTEAEWGRLLSAHRNALGEADPDVQMEIAEQLGPVAVDLFTQILKGQ